MATGTSSSSRPLPVIESPELVRLTTWLKLVRVFHLIHRRTVASLSQHQITLPQYDILATLRVTEGLTQQELAERLLVTKGNVCGVLDRLEGLGLLDRRQCCNDARANRLHLTPAGRRKVDTLVPAHDRVVLEAMRALSNPEVKALRELLAELERTNDA